MSMDKYVSVVEFAKLAGVTKQAVYSRINGQEFTNFIIEDNTGKKPKKLISTKALPLFNNGNSKQVKKPKKSSTDAYIDFLNEQIAEKDKLIDSLLQQSSALIQQNKELAESVAVMNKELASSISAMNDNLAKLWSQQQTLEAMEKKKLEAPEQSEPDSQEAPKAEPVQEKKPFFSRLFRK